MLISYEVKVTELLASIIDAPVENNPNILLSGMGGYVRNADKLVRGEVKKLAITREAGASRLESRNFLYMFGKI